MDPFVLLCLVGADGFVLLGHRHLQFIDLLKINKQMFKITNEYMCLRSQDAPPNTFHFGVTFEFVPATRSVCSIL